MSINNIKKKILSGVLAAAMSISLVAPMTSLALSSGTRMAINSSNIVRTVYPNKFDTVTAGSSTSVYHIGTGSNYGMCARSSHSSPAASTNGTLYQLTSGSSDYNGKSLSTNFSVTSYQGGGTATLGTFSEYQVLMAAARIADDVGSGRSYDSDVYCVLHVYASIILTGDTKYGVVASNNSDDLLIKNKVVTYINATATSGHTLYKWVPDNTIYQTLIVRDPTEDNQYTTSAAPVATTKYVNVDGNYYPGWGCTFQMYGTFSDACNNTNGHEMWQVRKDRDGQPTYWWYDKVTGFGMAEYSPNHDRSLHTVTKYFRETSPATMYYANGQWIDCECQQDDTIYYVTYTWQYEDDNGGGSWMRVQSGYYNSHTAGDYVQTNDKYINTNGSTWTIYGSDEQAAANNIPGWQNTPGDGSAATTGNWTDWLINGQGCGFFGDSRNAYWNVVNDMANVPAYVDLTQIKVDTENHAARGAVFTVYSDAACTQSIGTMSDPNNNGHYTFNMKIGDYNPSNANAQAGRTVYIKETTAANQAFINGAWKNISCRLDTRVYRVDVIYYNSDKTIHYSISSGGTFIINNNTIPATNVTQASAPDADLGTRVNAYAVTAYGSVGLNKVDQDGHPASGATFTVYSDSACRTSIGTMTEGTGNNRGSYTFTINNLDSDIFSGTHYSDETTAVTRTIYIKETGKPTHLYYDGAWRTWDFGNPSSTVHTIVLSWIPSTGKVTYTIDGGNSVTASGARTETTATRFTVPMGNIGNTRIDRASFTPTVNLTKVDDTGRAARGAVFTVYSDSACTQVVGTMSDPNNNGHYTYTFNSNLFGGRVLLTDNVTHTYNFYIRETSAATAVYENGRWIDRDFFLSTEIHEITFTWNPSTGLATWATETGSGNATRPSGQSLTSLSTTESALVDNVANVVCGAISIDKFVDGADETNTDASGFGFQLLDLNHNVVATGTTNAEGHVIWSTANSGTTRTNNNRVISQLPLGTYFIREIMPTDHTSNNSEVYYTFVPDGSEWTKIDDFTYQRSIEITEDMTSSVVFANPVEVTNIVLSGDLEIVKTLTHVNNLTEAQDFYFDIVYVNSDGTTIPYASNVKVTVPAGQTSATTRIEDVPLGTYRITEVPNDRYVVSYVVDEVTVTDDVQSHDGVFTFTVDNDLKRFDIDFTKYTILPDGSRVEGAVGDATLEGAVYRVFRDANGNGQFDNGEWFKDYTTNENGQFTTNDGDEIGELITGYTYYLYELSASEGYRVNGELLDISHAATEQNSHYARYVHEQSETVMDLNIKLLKLRNIDPETVVPEEGAQFEVYLTSAGSYENAREFERALITTDEDGYATTPKLPYGTYTVHQITSNYDETNIYISDFTVIGHEDGRVYMYTKINNLIELMLQIRKVDGTLEDALIPYAGAEFEIYRINTDGSETKVVERYGNASRSIFTTNDEGIIELTYPLTVGNYTLVEITAPFGYVVWDEPLEFEISRGEVDDEIIVGETGNERMYGRVIVDAVNTPVMGAAVVTKIGEGFTSVTYDEATNTYIPVWENVTLSGATFSVYAAEDIVALDGTIRFHKDQLVTTITTGEDGTATTGNILYLNADGIGRYYMVETVAPVGYALDTQRYSITVNYKNQTTPIVTASVAIMDTHFIPNLEVYKNLMPGTVSGTNGEVMDAHDYTQVTFGIYAAEDITAADGEKIPKDGLIEIIRCDADGLAVSTTKYPFGSYYVRELTTDRWHYMDSTAYGFEYNCPTSRTITEPVVTLGLSSVIRNTPETPNIGTTFTYNNSHVAPMNSTVTLVDTVEYEGLMPHTRYEMEGYIVVVNSDGTTTLFNNGETVGVSFETGNANNDDGTVSGSIDIEFEVDTTNLAGKSLVAFETLYHEGVKLAIHMDIHDENQTIVVPNIHTTATVNGQKEFEAGADITLVDTITYENLEVGRTYRVSGILMDKSTNQSLGVGECCADVLAETTFTPTTSSGTVTVEFHFNASALANGQELVVFEEIYDVETNTKIAEHKDITDTDQTVTVRVTTTPTPTPTPPTTITQTGEAISSTFYVGTILLIAGAFGIAVMVFRKRVKVEDGNADNTER